MRCALRTRAATRHGMSPSHICQVADMMRERDALLKRIELFGCPGGQLGRPTCESSVEIWLLNMLYWSNHVVVPLARRGPSTFPSNSLYEIPRTGKEVSLAHSSIKIRCSTILRLNWCTCTAGSTEPCTQLAVWSCRSPRASTSFFRVAEQSMMSAIKIFSDTKFVIMKKPTKNKAAQSPVTFMKPSARMNQLFTTIKQKSVTHAEAKSLKLKS
mmetsp:Transcript_60147/g.160060  ORF Transcript_60147/g.160060 Transcript_60147/m.160060 type:complete len:214 (-) Transcript_60147:1967-2608(-)